MNGDFIFFSVIFELDTVIMGKKAPFMNKTLSHEQNSQSADHEKAKAKRRIFKKQKRRILVKKRKNKNFVSVIRETKMSYYPILKTSQIIESFGKPRKECFQINQSAFETIISIENKNIIADDKDIRKSSMVFSRTLNIPRINHSH